MGGAFLTRSFADSGRFDVTISWIFFDFPLCIRRVRVPPMISEDFAVLVRLGDDAAGSLAEHSTAEPAWELQSAK